MQSFCNLAAAATTHKASGVFVSKKRLQTASDAASPTRQLWQSLIDLPRVLIGGTIRFDSVHLVLYEDEIVRMGRLSAHVLILCLVWFSRARFLLSCDMSLLVFFEQPSYSFGPTVRVLYLVGMVQNILEALLVRGKSSRFNEAGCSFMAAVVHMPTA